MASVMNEELAAEIAEKVEGPIYLHASVRKTS